MLANKQLRLDVAQLTDVGRKREHNEDNMAYVIPKDLQVMAQKGALFIVADGMGGHAAGEVASEIAVDTVSNSYYQDESDDPAGSLLRSIKRANTLIHQRAAENMLRSGMGTTCVAAVLLGNMAYIANVGDSRAYLVRHNQVKQISQDHSWVAEQVRAGLLTEEQARTHAQRNVITRCLGTQPDVDIDVFSEPLEEGDTLILCSDGLSGLMSDDEIRRIVEQSAPQESVYHLVEKANENGGPDNITAIVVSVQEVGVEPPGIRYPVTAGRINGNETGEETAILGLTPVSTVPSPYFGDNRNAGFGNFPASPLAPESPASPQPIFPASRSQGQHKRSRLFYPTAALLILLIVVIVGGGAYYVFALHTNTTNSAAPGIANAQQLIKQAQNEIGTTPAMALHNLGEAQILLRQTLQNSALTGQQHRLVLSILQGSFTQNVQRAITSYNLQANITALHCLSPSSNTINVGTTVQPKALAEVDENGKPSLFALGSNNVIYSISTTNNSLIPYSSLPDSLSHAQIMSITGYNGTQLAMLASQPGSSSPIPTYSLVFLTPGQKKIDATIPIQTKNGEAPSLITASNQEIYVVLTTSTLLQISIWQYRPSTSGNHALSPNPTPSTVSVSTNVVSIAAFPDQELFFLSQSGSVQSFKFASGNQTAASVLLEQAIPQPLTVSSQGYTWKTTVPTTTDGAKTLDILGATSPSALVAADVQNVEHLYVMDTNLHRILDLKLAVNSTTPTSTPTTSTATPTTSTATPSVKVAATPTNVGGGVSVGSSPDASTLQLQKQYASPTLFATMKSMVVDSSGTNISVLAQSPHNASPSLVSFNTTTNPQSNCG